MLQSSLAVALFLGLACVCFSQQPGIGLASHKPVRVIKYNSEWGTHAAHNLSKWRSGLFQATEKYIVGQGDTDRPGGWWARFQLFQPFISCPPDRPLRRVGPPGDGGKWLCEPAAEAAPCTIVSIGSNMDFRFEEAILNETRCNVVTADCTVDGKVLSDRHKFLKVCIGSAAQAAADPKILTYADIMHRVGLESLPLLKIDVEGYEYPVFAQWHETTRGLPDQISVEVHWHKSQVPHPPGLPPQWGRSEFGILDLALFFSHLGNLGYGIVSQEINPECNSCSEFTLLRVEMPHTHEGPLPVSGTRRVR